MWGAKATTNVSVMCCKPCLGPHDSEERPRYLPAGFIECVASSVSDKCPPIHAWDIDVTSHVDAQLRVIYEVGSTDRLSIVPFLDDPVPGKFILQPALYSTDPTAGNFSWCLQLQKAGGGTVCLPRHDGSPSI